ncbi:SGNH/GDSL hydrolase family protein [Metabacillus endolithicus]|uniref:SGNH/GDSL hydrolase family protein n=1 Tax=Metabacillus endolithicus TaxID=1535204 RepID=A0ABW5BW30_9BACI|nr:SGNH/GDSL hydrolase family protein [Metabacillus endolithicus]UPG64218.1 SGNH/GDSL hydrolase family protein [Metabacillus endolithicus]
MLQKLVLFSIIGLCLTGCMNQPAAKLEYKPVSLSEKETPAEEFFPKTMKVVGIGDSLTKGVGDGAELGGYVGRVTEMLEEQDHIKDVLVENYGVKGHKTSNLQKKLTNDKVIESIKEADMVVMTIGGNDIMNVVRQNIFSLDFEPFRAEQKLYEERLRNIIITIRSYNSDAQIVFVGLYNPFKYMLPNITEIDQIIDEWNSVSKQMITEDENGIFVSVADIFSTSEVDNKLLYKDEFHPNESGYTLIAERVYDSISKAEVSLNE